MTDKNTQPDAPGMASGNRETSTNEGGGATFNIGPGATIKYIIGRDNTGQIIEFTQSELATVTERLTQLQQILDAQQLAPQDKAEAQAKFDKLKQELTKGEQPNGEVIKEAGDGLLKKVPALLNALVSLFTSPIVGKLVEVAGNTAVAWVKSLQSSQKGGS